MPFRPGPLATTLACLLLALLLVPNLVAIPASLTDQTYLSLPHAGLSLQHYRRFLEDPGWRNAFLLSFGTAAAATAIATPLGAAAAIGAWTLRSRAAQALRAVVLLPIVVPGIVSAIAVFGQWTAFGLYDTVPGVILAQVLVAMPFVVIAVSSALARFDLRLVDAARSMGAGRLRIVLQVVIPVIRPALLAGTALAFVSAWDESVITLFVTGRRVQVLPRMMWDGLRYDIDPIVAVVATVMLMLTTAGVALGLALRRPTTAGAMR